MTDLIEYANPRALIRTWEQYFSKYIAYVRSHGANYVEAHRSIDGQVLLISDVSLCEGVLQEFISLFTGHKRLMGNLFYIFTKNAANKCAIELSGVSDNEKITVTHITAAARQLDILIPARTSLSKRIDTNKKMPKCFILLARPNSGCNVARFCEEMYDLNYFNIHPTADLLSTNSPLELCMCHNVIIHVNSEKSKILNDLTTAFKSKDVSIIMQYKEFVVSARATILYYDVSTEPETRPMHVVISGVHFPELDAVNLPCFADFPTTAQIYVFINGKDALEVLNLPNNVARALISTSAILLETSSSDSGAMRIDSTAPSESQTNAQERKGASECLRSEETLLQVAGTDEMLHQENKCFQSAERQNDDRLSLDDLDFDLTNQCSPTPTPSDLSIESVKPSCQLVNSGPLCPPDWIMNLALGKYRCERHNINITLIIKTCQDVTSNVSKANIRMLNVPEWLDWNVEDEHPQCIRLFTCTGSSCIDAMNHTISITVRHPRYDANMVKVELVIPQRLSRHNYS